MAPGLPSSSGTECRRAGRRQAGKGWGDARSRRFARRRHCTILVAHPQSGARTPKQDGSTSVALLSSSSRMRGDAIPRCVHAALCLPRGPGHLRTGQGQRARPSALRLHRTQPRAAREARSGGRCIRGWAGRNSPRRCASARIAASHRAGRRRAVGPSGCHASQWRLAITRTYRHPPPGREPGRSPRVAPGCSSRRKRWASHRNRTR
jgi:hypothetical protein